MAIHSLPGRTPPGSRLSFTVCLAGLAALVLATRLTAQEIPIHPVPAPYLSQPIGGAGASFQEPARAHWGDVWFPRTVPASVYPLQYDLVPPPDGITQVETAPLESVLVGQPDTVLADAGPNAWPIDLARPDGLAPIGVVGDHTLDASGEILVSYRYGLSLFDGVADGTDQLSSSNVLGTWGTTPSHARQQRHTLLLEYGVTSDLTLLALLPFQDMTIRSRDGLGGVFDSSTVDPGDLGAQALLVLWRGDRQQIHLNLGVQLPVGVDQTSRNPPLATSPNDTYVLRPWSGTYAFLPGLTWRGQTDDWTWGLQGLGTVRLGTNSYGYRLGDRGNLTGWMARRLSERWSLSGRLDGQIWGNLHGADDRLNLAITPLNLPGAQGGRRLDLLGGFNWYLPGGDLVAGQWFSLEGGAPVYQDLDGPQLRNRWTLIAGYNLAF